MGQTITSTYSYESNVDALRKMLKQLFDADIAVVYSNSKSRYYILENSGKQRFLVVGTETDIWGKRYFKCHLH